MEQKEKTMEVDVLKKEVNTLMGMSDLWCSTHIRLAIDDRLLKLKKKDENMFFNFITELGFKKEFYDGTLDKRYK